MDYTHLLTKTLPNVSTEMSLHVAVSAGSATQSCQLIQASVRPERKRKPQEDRRKPLQRTLSLPAGCCLGILMSSLGPGSVIFQAPEDESAFRIDM